MSDALDIEGEDWRLLDVGRLSEPYKWPGVDFVLPAGTPYRPSATVSVGKGKASFALPNATAIFLSLSERSYQSAVSLVTEQHLNSSAKTNRSIDADVAFDYFEHVIASVVFAYTALEAFANESIPDDYVYSAPRKDGRSTEVFDKFQAERSLNLDTKLSKVLPLVFGVSSPMGGKLWTPYEKLRKLRDRIIHMKSEDRNRSEPDSDTVWQMLLKTPVPHMAPVAKQLMGYFLDKAGAEHVPRWYRKYPH